VIEKKDGRKEERRRAIKMDMVNKRNGKREDEVMLEKDGRWGE
jgi:hypothetical protein